MASGATTYHNQQEKGKGVPLQAGVLVSIERHVSDVRGKG